MRPFPSLLQYGPAGHRAWRDGTANALLHMEAKCNESVISITLGDFQEKERLKLVYRQRHTPVYGLGRFIGKAPW